MFEKFPHRSGPSLMRRNGPKMDFSGGEVPGAGFFSSTILEGIGPIGFGKSSPQPWPKHGLRYFQGE